MIHLLTPPLIILILVLINGLFVAAEFSIIGVRASRMEQLAKEGNRQAQRIRGIVSSRRKTDRYIATAQLGITLASLGLGMYGEPAIAHLLEEPMYAWFGLEGAIAHAISLVIALTLITYLHVVVGEMVPKSLALQSAERTVLWLAEPMALSGKLFSVPVRVLNWIGLLILKLLNVPSPGSKSRLYTPDELELIVSESYTGGVLAEHEREMVSHIFDFAERRAVQVMTPRMMMTAIPITLGEEELLKLMSSAPHSRLPVYEDNIENIVGMVHLKDIVRQQLAGERFDLRSLLRQVPYVPEAMPLEALLRIFRQLRLHMAIVIDEHGGTAGLVTLEDLIEEVFGEVRDEFDTEEEAPLILVEPGHLLVQGTMLVETINETYVNLGDPDHNVQTIGGLVLAKIDRLPVEGDEVRIGKAKLRVEAVEGLTIKQVSIRYPTQGEAEGREATV